MTDKIWQMEERLWTGGGKSVSSTLSDLCILAMPQPVGTVIGADIREKPGHVPQWDLVAMTEQTTTSPTTGVIVLAYRAEGRRSGAAPYTALCTSTYAFENDRWSLVQHHQTQLS